MEPNWMQFIDSHSLAAVVGDGPHARHSFQMLRRMVRVNHLVLDGAVVSAKELDGFATGVIKVGNVIDGTVNDDLGGAQRLDGRNANRRFGRFILYMVPLAMSQLVCVWRHGLVGCSCYLSKRSTTWGRVERGRIN